MPSLNALYEAQLDSVARVNEPDPDKVIARQKRREELLSKPCTKCGGPMKESHLSGEIFCTKGGDNCAW